MEIKLYSETGSARETVTHLTTRLWDGMGWTDGRTYAAPDTSGPQEREAKLSGKGRVGYNNVITGRINYGAKLCTRFAAAGNLFTFGCDQA